jgi:hypothetical protein
MSDFSLEEILMTEEFSQHIYRWWNENKIIKHALSRADYVRQHNQHIQVIFDDLKELNYLLESGKYTEAVCHYGWMDDEAKALVTPAVVNFIEKQKVEADQ